MDERVVASLVRLGAAFPQAHVPDSTVKLYASKMAGLDSDVLVDVIEHSISNARSFPTIAELRDDYQREYGRRVQQASDESGLPVVASVCEHGVEGICDECRANNVVRLRKIRERLADRMDPERMDADEAPPS